MADSRPVTIRVPGAVLRGTYVPAPPSGMPAILFLHGWGGTEKRDAAEYLASLGYPSMTYAMRGHGASGGTRSTLSRKEAVEDAVAAYDALVQRAGKRPVIVVGASFGGYVAALLAGMRPVAGLSLRVPANYPDEGYEHPVEPLIDDEAGLAAWRNASHSPSSSAMLHALAAFSGPVQIVPAEKDATIPKTITDEIIDAVKKENRTVYVLKGAPHHLATKAQNAEYIRELATFVAATARTLTTRPLPSREGVS